MSTYPLESVVIPKIFSSFFEKIKSTNVDNQVFINFFKVIFTFMIITTIAHTFVSKLDIFLIPEFNESVSNTIFEKIIYYYENNYTDLELGKILTRINGLPSVLREVTTDLFNWVLPKLLTLIIINIYFYKMDRILGIGSILVLLFIVIYNVKSFKPCISISNKRYENYEEKSEELQDKLSNLFTIYSSGTIDNEINDYKETTKLFKNIHRQSMTCNHNIKNNNSLITTIIFISMCCYISYLYKIQKISKENLLTLFMILIFYIPCLNTIITYLPDYINHLGIIKSVDDYIDNICIDNNNKPDIIINDGNIEIINLTFGYTKDNNLFNNFNLNINSQDKLAIIGRSGNGKSTLIKLIMGYYPVPDNTIFIDGQDINKYNLTSLRKQIIYINQNTKLFNKTIFENIKYGNNVTDEDIMNVYNRFNLDRVYKNLPHKFNTNVGVNGDSVSGGQKQIILLLRNYFKNNKIIILDEPTSALDIDTQKVVIDLVKEISKNSTLIIITHDFNNIEITNKQIEILNGTII
jgi:ATP-binding cassette subfamily B protein/subfamily B ATP-binding cassette protein MsbA